MIVAEKIVNVRREPNHKLMFENALVRVYWVDLAVDAATEFHQHDFPYAGVIVGDAKIRNQVVGAEESLQELRDGDVLYSTGEMAHRVENVGAGRFRNFAIELLRSGAHQESSLRRLQREGRNLRLQVDKPLAGAAILELAAGERCEMIGEHIVVWLGGLLSASTFCGSVMLSTVGDFTWCDGISVLESEEGARVAIVELR